MLLYRATRSGNRDGFQAQPKRWLLLHHADRASACESIALTADDSVLHHTFNNMVALSTFVHSWLSSVDPCRNCNPTPLPRRLPSTEMDDEAFRLCPLPAGCVRGVSQTVDAAIEGGHAHRHAVVGFNGRAKRRISQFTQLEDVQRTRASALDAIRCLKSCIRQSRVDPTSVCTSGRVGACQMC